MAPPTHFSTITLPIYIKGISDAVIQDNVLLAKLQDAGRIQTNQGGNGFEFRVRVEAANIGGVVTDQNQGVAKTLNVVKTCVARYRPYLWRLFENALEIDRNQFAPAPSQIADQQEEDLNIIKQEATARIGAHLYGDGATLLAGDVGIPIEGLESLIAGAGTTYFGLSRDTYTNLRAQVVACANPSMYDDGINNNLLKSMEELYVACQGGKAGTDGKIADSVATAKEEIDAIVTTSTLFRRFREAMLPQQQYVTDKNNPRKELAYGNAAISWDVVCTANRMYFVNTKHIEVKVVGPQLIRIMSEVPLASPVGKITVIGGQLQAYSKAPRYHGKLTVTGS